MSDKKEKLVVDNKKITSSRQSLDELEKTVLTDNPKDINLSTKINLLNERLKNLRKNKTETKDKQEKANIQEEINAIIRDKNRIVRFHIVSKNKINGIDNLEKEDVDSINAKKLLQIEKEKTGFLSSAFAYKQTKDVEGNVTEEPLTNL
jgi:hypothetical protein